MFYQDEELVEQFKTPEYVKEFGKYLGTYTDENQQVIVDLCLERTGVTAHVQPQNGLKEEEITVNWWKAVHEIVRELGYPRVVTINHGYQFYS